MARTGEVVHVSDKSGGAMDRVRAAHLSPVPRTLAENVGRAFSTVEVENGFHGQPQPSCQHLQPRHDPHRNRCGCGPRLRVGWCHSSLLSFLPAGSCGLSGNCGPPAGPARGSRVAGRVGVRVSEFVWVRGRRKAWSEGVRAPRVAGPCTPGGLRDGQPTLPTSRASRSPVALTPSRPRKPLSAGRSTLPLPLTMADSRRPEGGSFMGASRFSVVKKLTLDRGSNQHDRAAGCSQDPAFGQRTEAKHGQRRPVGVEYALFFWQ